MVRKRDAGKAWLGATPLTFANGGLRAGVVPFDSPLYKAGVAQDDQIVSLAGFQVTSMQDVQDVLQRTPAGRAARAALRAAQRRGR